MFCNKCGNEIKDGEKFCGKCGAPVTTKEQSNVTQKILHNTKEVISEVVTNRENIKKKVKDNKKIVIIIIAILLVIVVGHSRQNNQKNNKTISTSKTSSSDVSSTSTKSNKVSNIVEKSNTSFTGMTFKKSWSELKEELDVYYNERYKDSTSEALVMSNWKEMKEYKNVITYCIVFYQYRSPTVTESARGLKTVQYEVCDIMVYVDENTKKVIGAGLTIGTEGIESNKYVECFVKTLMSIDNQVAETMSEFFKVDDGDTRYYKNNIVAYTTSSSETLSYLICAADKEKEEYLESNRVWEDLKPRN